MSMDIYTPNDTDVIHSTKVDFRKRTIQDTIHIVQFDKSLPVIAVALRYNGYSYTAPDNSEVWVRWGKKDHTYVYKKCMVSSDRKTVYFDVDYQMTVIYGVLNPILELIVGERTAGSSPIPVIIDRNPIQDSDIESRVEDSTVAELRGEDLRLHQEIADVDSRKQDKLTFDDTPRMGSSNPVTSEGIKMAIADSQAHGIYNYKGQVPSYSDLPTSGRAIGDVWEATDTGINWAWNGSSWDNKGTGFKAQLNLVLTQRGYKHATDSDDGRELEVARALEADKATEADLANNLIATKGLEVESYFTFEKTGGEQASAIETGNGTLKNLYGKTEKCKNLSHVATLSVGVVTPIGTTLKSGETYSFTFKGTLASGHENMTVALVDDNSHQTVVWMNASSIRVTKTITLERDYSNIIIWGASGDSVENLMIVKGNTALDYEEYYSGLKHTHITGLKSTRINLFNEKMVLGTVDTTTGNVISISDRLVCEDFVEVLPNQDIYFRRGETATNMRLCYYDINHNFIKGEADGAPMNRAYTTPSLCHYIKFGLQSSYGTTYRRDICINFSNPTYNGNYYPFEQDTLDIEFEGNGVGTASDEINVEEGKKYQRFGIVDLGTLNWIKEDASDNLPSNNTFTVRTTSFQNLNRNVLSTIESRYISSANDADTEKVLYYGHNYYSLIYADSNISTVEQLKAAMSGVMLVYELATPIVTDIEIPKYTIKVWNGGSMEALGTEVPVGTKIFYQKNIKNFIEGLGEATNWDPESINDKADKVDTYTKAETDTAIQTAINNAILTALNTAV